MEGIGRAWGGDVGEPRVGENVRDGQSLARILLEDMMDQVARF